MILSFWISIAYLTNRTVAAKNWGVIVVGSKGYVNYRHQADGCHCYHVLVNSGMPKEQIIMLSYDDAAHAEQNPFPGKLYNAPGGKDLRNGCNPNYTGEDVTPELFIAVITGNQPEARRLTNSTNAPVLQSKASDDVLIYFTDHGGDLILSFPNWKSLHENDLTAALRKMNENAMYSKMIFYVEACKAGTLFDEPTDLPPNFLAITASYRTSSYATYCPPNDSTVQGTDIATCLADQFSNNAWTYIDNKGLENTVNDQYTFVKANTSLSNVSAFGDDKILKELLKNFFDPEFSEPPLEQVTPPTPMPTADEAIMLRGRRNVTVISDAEVQTMKPVHQYETAAFARAASETQAREWHALSMLLQQILARRRLHKVPEVQGETKISSGTSNSTPLLLDQKEVGLYLAHYWWKNETNSTKKERRWLEYQEKLAEQKHTNEVFAEIVSDACNQNEDCVKNVNNGTKMSNPSSKEQTDLTPKQEKKRVKHCHYMLSRAAAGCFHSSFAIGKSGVLTRLCITLPLPEEDLQQVVLTHCGTVKPKKSPVKAELALVEGNPDAAQAHQMAIESLNPSIQPLPQHSHQHDHSHELDSQRASIAPPSAGADAGPQSSSHPVPKNARHDHHSHQNPATSSPENKTLSVPHFRKGAKKDGVQDNDPYFKPEELTKLPRLEPPVSPPSISPAAKQVQHPAVHTSRPLKPLKEPETHQHEHETEDQRKTMPVESQEPASNPPARVPEGKIKGKALPGPAMVSTMTPSFQDHVEHALQGSQGQDVEKPKMEQREEEPQRKVSHSSPQLINWDEHNQDVEPGTEREMLM